MNKNTYIVESYIVGQALLRCILFSREAFYYDWTSTEDIILILCVGLFMFLHYGTIIFLKIKKKFWKNTSITLLNMEIVFCVLWIIYVLFFFLIGASFSNAIYLEIVFNILPIIIRLIFMGITRGQGDGSLVTSP